jgi:hypothetical protein
MIRMISLIKNSTVPYRAQYSYRHEAGKCEVSVEKYKGY